MTEPQLRHQEHAGGGSARPLGATRVGDGVNFAVYAPDADWVAVVLFDADETEFRHVVLSEFENGTYFGLVEGVPTGATYGLRADGPNAPDQGYFFDPAKLLVDPYARQLTRQLVQHGDLRAPRGEVSDTARHVPKALIDVTDLPLAHPIGLKGHGPIYEANVRGFSKLRTDLPEAVRGTVGAMTTPNLVSHVERLGVSALELMPVTAWLNERHLEALGLQNSWGYNPITYFAPDPRLMPGGMADLRQLTDRLRARDIPVILDVVYNHSGESDIAGAIVSMKGLAPRQYYRWVSEGDRKALVNDAGTGNTLDCTHPEVIALTLESLRYWVEQGGVSGFRFDLATVLGRTESGFDRAAPLLNAILSDDLLSQCILIAEPWDIGPGGYQLGAFPPSFLEWNDRYRDDVRAFWAGEGDALGAFAGAIAGSRELFEAHGKTGSATVNFIAAHDGFTLADLVAYAHKHNEANGEHNRDGHNHNLSWNNGYEGPTTDPHIVTRRGRDIRALLATLFVSRGHIMLGQGDEMGRTQGGNNNAYAQDNEIGWINWDRCDTRLRDYASRLAALRNAHPLIGSTVPLTGRSIGDRPEVVWRRHDGVAMTATDWEADAAVFLCVDLANDDDRMLVLFNRGTADVACTLPHPAPNHRWTLLVGSSGDARAPVGDRYVAGWRSVSVLKQVAKRSA